MFILKSLQKQLFLLGVMLFLASTLSAQTIEWGSLNKASSKWYNPTVLNEDGESVYTAHLDDNNIVIERHNAKGEVVYSTPIKLNRINDDKAYIEHISYIKDRFILFASAFDNSTDKVGLYAFSYDGKTGKQLGKQTMLFEFPVEKMKRKGRFYFYMSSDRSKILINHFAYYKKEDKLKDRYKLFDNELKELLEKTEIFNNKDIDYTTYNYVIDNEGSVYYLRRMNKGESFIVSYDVKKDYEKWEEQVDISKLDKTHSVGFVKFAFDNSNDLVIAGICNEKEKDGKGLFWDIPGKVKPAGMFYTKVDRKSKEIKTMKVHKFAIKTGLKTDFYTFENQTMHFTANNDLVFINQIKNVQYGRNVAIFYDGELIIAKFDKDGEMKWNNCITKMQISTISSAIISTTPSFVNSLYFTYLSGVNSDKLFLIYNDNPKNLNVTNPKKIRSVQKFRKTVPFLCSIDLATGQSTTTQMFDPKITKNFIKTKVRFQKDYKSDIITLAQYKGKYQIVRIKLNK